MSEHEIPSPFRQVFGGPTLDEPAPPPPVEPADGGDGGHFHHVFDVPMPIFAVYPDGGVVAQDWRGTLFLVWLGLATFVTSWAIAAAVWSAASFVTSVTALLMIALAVGATSIGLTTLWAIRSVVGRWQRWRARRWAGSQKP